MHRHRLGWAAAAGGAVAGAAVDGGGRAVAVADTGAVRHLGAGRHPLHGRDDR